ncbi:methyl-accepting chemotaxis protein [Acidocella sp.]|uniref:methyl-accepting chemotaxis protein n=1 Tax=Acidocella sp. TaxID=50710 RepID=UPI002624EAEE|nr:methyl-accepting chemotaxis protein [Acidocella sp.]
MSRFFQRLSITWQLMGLFFMALTLMSTGTIASLWQCDRLSMATTKNEIIALATTGQSIAQYYVRQAETGAMTTQQAQAAALAAIGAMRYNGTDYLFVFTKDGTVLAHINKAWIGTNKLTVRDPSGHLVNQPLISSAMSGHPAFNFYEFPKTPGGKPEPKLSYALAVPAWGWVIGTGLYIDDVDAQILHSALFLLAIFMPLILLYMLEVLVVRAHIARLLAGLSHAMRALAEGALDTPIPATTRTDELGQMAHSLQSFKDAAKAKRQLETETQSARDNAERERAGRAAEQAKLHEDQQRAVSALAQGLESLAKGDLTTRLTQHLAAAYAKLATDFNSTATQLEGTMQAIARSGQGVRAGAGEMMQAVDDLSLRTERQAASLSQTSAALADLTHTVRQTAEGTSNARHATAEARAAAERSGTIMTDAVSAMDGIKSSSRQIENIIGVIDEIAFQTNLLALNAGVEAARAGEAGRGFAVVATEVRALAQRSADAAKEIKTLISTSSIQVGAGVRLVGEAGEALARIVAQITHLNELVGTIAASASSQAAGLAQVSHTIEEMDQVTQQNAAMVEQATAASHSLADEAQALEQFIARFRLGQNRAPTPSPTRRVPALAPAERWHEPQLHQ